MGKAKKLKYSKIAPRLKAAGGELIFCVEVGSKTGFHALIYYWDFKERKFFIVDGPDGVQFFFPKTGSNGSIIRAISYEFNMAESNTEFLLGLEERL